MRVNKQETSIKAAKTKLLFLLAHMRYVEQSKTFGKEPARQLNSITIQNSARYYLTPILQRGLAVFSAKCVWRVAEGREGLIKAWQMICEKRSECDKLVRELRNVEFFFSVIGILEEKSKNDVHKDDALQENDELAQDQSQTTSILSAVQRNRYPAIVYWIAVSSTGSAPVQDIGLRKALLKCNVEVEIKNIPYRKGREEKCIRSLFTVLKDHNSSYMCGLVNECCQKSFEQAFTDVTDEEPTSSQVSEMVIVENVVRFTLVSQASKTLQRALTHLQSAGLEMDVVGMPTEILDDAALAPTAGVSTDPCVLLLHDIEKIMKALNFALCKGHIFKLVRGAMFTYQLKCDVEKFVGTLEGNKALTARIIKHGNRVVRKLRDPNTQAIRQIRIDYDLIEIGNGRCLSLSERNIKTGVLQDDDIGVITPRAFCPYDGTMEECQAKYFQEVLLIVFIIIIIIIITII